MLTRLTKQGYDTLESTVGILYDFCFIYIGYPFLLNSDYWLPVPKNTLGKISDGILIKLKTDIKNA